jgi:hypothetical protein
LTANISATPVANKSSEQGVVLSPEILELLDVMRSWLEEDDPEDEAEQKATWEYLKKALDEDRLSDRKLFP